MKITSILRAGVPALLSLSVSMGTSSALADAGMAGKPGNAASASRTVNVTMHDNYYEPEQVTVKPGETIKFVVTNKGSLVHEFNIGTPASHAAHAPEMQMLVDHGVIAVDHINHDVAKQMQKSMGHGMHNMPNSALLEPGKSGTVVWQFPAGGTVEFACNVPGHYDAGMVGQIQLAN